MQTFNSSNETRALKMDTSSMTKRVADLNLRMLADTTLQLHAVVFHQHGGQVSALHDLMHMPNKDLKIATLQKGFCTSLNAPFAFRLDSFQTN